MDHDWRCNTGNGKNHPAERKKPKVHIQYGVDERQGFGTMRLMTRMLVFLLVPFILLPAADAPARRRRPVVKEVPTFSITGNVVAKESPPSTEEEKGVAFLRSLREKAYHRFRDPLVIVPPRQFLSSRLAVVVWNTQAPKASPFGRSLSVRSLVIRGGAFIPQLFVLHYEADFHLINRDRREVRVFSPGRIVNGQQVAPEILAPEIDRVYPIHPRGSETEDKEVKFWSYPLRIVGSPYSVGRVLFVRSHHFTLVNDDGSFELPPLPAGKYEVSILDRNRILHTQEVVIPERGKGELKPMEVEITLPFSMEEF